MVSTPRDANRVTTLLGTSSTDGSTPVSIYADPTTHRLLTSGAISATVTAQATTPKTLAASESGTIFSNEGATGAITFNLPTAVANYVYTFIVQDADGINITAAAADTIRFGGTVTATAGTISSTTIGSTITLVAINATEWVATSLIGSWA